MSTISEHIQDQVAPAVAKAWPTMTAAARMVGQDKSVLSHDHTAGVFQTVRFGRQSLRVRPSAVLDLAVRYNRELPTEVAAALIDYAAQHADTAAVTQVTSEVDEWLSGQWSNAAQIDDADLIDAVRAYMPPELAERVVARIGS